MELKRISDYIGSYLEIDAFHDDSTNGLQVENSKEIEKIGLAVDASREAICKAVEAKCDLLIVHHGLFWGRQQLVIDHHYQRIRALIMADMALYAAHIPLDAHQEIGHNRVIAQLLDLDAIEPFALYYGKPIGVKGRLKAPGYRRETAAWVEQAIGSCRGVLEFGTETIRSVAIVAGSATDPELFRELRRNDIDLFITGEPKHGAYHLAQEYGLNIFYGGHYQSETFGIKALGDHLHKQFAIPTVFISEPCDF